jgi:hypothetical protein
VDLFDGAGSRLEHKFYPVEANVWNSLLSNYNTTDVHVQASKEFTVLKAIQAAVESRFINGVPPHRSPSARSVEYNPNGSSIYIVDWTEFQTLAPRQVQDIFRHRHILLRNAPVERGEFTLEGLEMLGSVTRQVSLQGPSYLVLDALLSFVL